MAQQRTHQCFSVRAGSLLLIVFGWLIAPAIVEAAQDKPLRVLLLYPTDLMLPAVTVQDRITREAIVAKQTRAVEFYSESFDMYRLPGSAQEQQFVEFLNHKYADHTPDLIVTHGPMHEIMRRHRNELWPRAPLLFADVGAHRIRNGDIPPEAPYTSLQIDYLGTARLALRLQPKTERVLLASGDSSYDRESLERARLELEQIGSDVTIDELTGLSPKQIAASLSALRKGTIVLYLSMQRDAFGNTHVPREVLDGLAEASAVPIYGVVDTYIGHGIVGGNLMNREGQREAIGDIAWRLLRGESTSNQSASVIAPSMCSVDWRQIQRWDIDERLIPTDCRVMFRTPTWWQRHPVLITGAAIALLLQGAWIFAWHLQRVRSKNAEQTVRSRTAELTHAARLGTVGELMASITHEISQPLASILTNAAAGERMIASGQPDIDEIRSILADIRADDARAGSVVSHLRDFLKKREVAMAPVHLNELIGDVLKLLEGEARHKKVNVVTTLDEQVAIVPGDAIHLQQVILNLAMNAIEAMSSQVITQRTLTIGTTWNAAVGIEVAVSDTGCGIPPERLPYLFEPFYTTKADGMGIGLSIAQMIIEAHGGRIWVESFEAGTTMRFNIPVHRKLQENVSQPLLRA
jgi:signal transduction histidine kinase